MQRMHCLVWLALLTGGLVVTGCGSSDSSGAVNATAVDQRPAKDPRDPKQVVSDFLDLKQRGNHAEADKLLSEKACGVTQRVQLKIVEIPPDGSVRYEVGAVEMLSGGAHVQTTWTVGEGDAKQTATMLFVARDDARGWRIIGVIMRPPGETSQPIALDFEDEQQIRSYIAAQTAPQSAAPPSEQQPPAAETAAKPSPKAPQTTKQ